ncbi:MAG: MBOAT family protein [Holophagales bacterium]|nr:MBOAT family protein [Holophagales bacterium]
MSLAEPLYLVFLAIAVLGARFVGNRAPRALVLVPLSLVFYATWNPLALLPLLATAAVDFHVSRALVGTDRPALRRALVATSVVVDLGLLSAFKYSGLLARAAAPLVGRADDAAWPPFTLVLAAGISFYTFQSLGCVLDVYRRDEEPPARFLDYLAFVSFFPTLLAGPITRAGTFFPQAARPLVPLSDADGSRALFRIGLGLAKKLLIADVLAVNLVDRVFEVPGLFTSAEAALATYGYAVQIWADFSGYSDIALGSALLLGFRLKENFDSPYRSADLAEFWRRWHISLSTWLRDYLFFSLPGNRRGGAAPYANLVVTFVLGGLWHGTTWAFAGWGLIHGAGLAIQRLFESRRRRGVAPRSGWRRALGIVVTFHVVSFAWILFRSESTEAARAFLRVLFAGTGGVGNVPFAAAAALVLGLAAHFVPARWHGAAEVRFAVLPSVAQAGLFLALLATIRLSAGASVAPFVYFRF